MSRTDTFGCHGLTEMLTSVIFLKISVTLKEKYINVLKSIFGSKKSMTVFFCNVQFLTCDLLKISLKSIFLRFFTFYPHITIFFTFFIVVLS